MHGDKLYETKRITIYDVSMIMYLKLLIIVPIVVLPDSGERFRWLSLWTIWRWHLLPADTGDVATPRRCPPPQQNLHFGCDSTKGNVLFLGQHPNENRWFWHTTLWETAWNTNLLGWVVLHLRWHLGKFSNFWRCHMQWYCWESLRCRGRRRSSLGHDGVCLLNVEMDDEWQGDVVCMFVCAVWLDWIVC